MDKTEDGELTSQIVETLIALNNLIIEAVRQGYVVEAETITTGAIGIGEFPQITINAYKKEKLVG